MSVDVDIDLPSLTQAKLRSERIRILCMIGLFAAFSLLGLFRIVVPLNGTPSVGWIVFGISLAYLAFEALMFRAVARRLEMQRTLSRWLSAVHGASECLYPIVTLFSLMLLVPEDRYTLLVSPGYGFLLVLIAVSVLRADWQATALTGAVATLGYAGLVMFGLLGGKAGTVNPHPRCLVRESHADAWDCNGGIGLCCPSGSELRAGGRAGNGNPQAARSAEARLGCRQENPGEFAAGFNAGLCWVPVCRRQPTSR